MEHSEILVKRHRNGGVWDSLDWEISGLSSNSSQVDYSFTFSYPESQNCGGHTVHQFKKSVIFKTTVANIKKWYMIFFV